MIRDKIIIVEDDPGISKYLQAALRSHEYDTLLPIDRHSQPLHDFFPGANGFTGNHLN